MNDEALLDALADGACVITATPRLARELRASYDRRQLQRDKTAWRDVDVSPYAAWLPQAWQWLGAGARKKKLLLQELQTLGMWRQIIARDIAANSDASAPLWNDYATAKTARSAWQVLHEWQISLNACAESSHADHMGFVRWARAYQKQCDKNAWLDRQTVAAAVVEQLADKNSCATLAHAHFIFHGFDDFTPLQQRVIDALGGQRKVDITPPPAQPASISRGVCFQDSAAEWLAAGHWAREKLTQNPRAKLAIVCPDMQGARRAVAYALQQTLQPSTLLQPDLPIDAFHVSLGGALSDAPPVHAALQMLSALSARETPAERMFDLILSPYLGGALAEKTARSRLAAWCEDNMAFAYRPTQLQFALHERQSQGCPDAPILKKLIDKTLRAVRARPNKAAFAVWAETFHEDLERMNWPGEQTLDSRDYQSRRAFVQLLQRLAELDLAQKPVSADTALMWLQRLAADRTFQVESGDEPVQVLGVHEAAGLRFDAIWFGDLTEKTWPPPARVNPFIPPVLQDAAGMPDADATRHFEAHEKIQRRLQASCDEWVLSRPRYDAEVPMLASALFDDAKADADEHAHAPLHERWRGAKLESFQDDTGAKRLQSATAGGASLIQTQAVCPGCAYARYRLHAKNPAPREQGLNAMERGSLVHRVLQLAWDEIRDSDALRAMPEQKLRDIFHHAIEEADKRYQVISGCGDAFFQAQTFWLLQLLHEWFALEKLRSQNFQVVHTEVKRELTLGELQLNLKIDRIDKFSDGEIGLIDYKTGTVDAWQKWADERPTAPQLPLYAMTEAKVALLAFAKVKLGDCRFVGVSEGLRLASDCKQVSMQVFMKPKAPGEDAAFIESMQPQTDEWADTLELWREKLNAVAAEFMQGDARINPLGDANHECDAPSFCRRIAPSA